MNKKNNSIILNNPVADFIQRNMGILIGLVVLSVFLSFSTDTFLTSRNLISVLRQICVNSLIALGMTFVLIIGGIDLTVGSVVGACGVSVVIFINRGIPVFMSILLAILIGALIGLLNGVIIAYTGMPPFIVTLSLQQTIRGVAYIITDGRSVACKNKTFDVIGNGYTPLIQIPVPILIVLAAIVAASIILYYMKFGRRMYAIGGNINAAKFSGIKVKSITIRVYVISAMLAALAGIILASRMYSGQPTAGNAYESDAIAAAVLGGTSFMGGIGTVGGTIIGAMVIGFLNNGLNLLHVSSYAQMVIKGIVIITAVGIDLLKKGKQQ
ncbi:ribose ABC transporter permease [Clostridium sp. AM58-1XD]|uniref:ABC transporter permease n=1 Tax=Clostridium sp. AM58-1XD TaxID=2292307 RepID=UPI000E4D7CCF|nr:ribose ABC transporter permease [Clostridium sp. AM58-1XD]RGY98211.1 ribose ABC transporter permease [Clostridium sp. AM58-1XD]